MRFHTVAFKTLGDLFSLRRSILFVAAVVLAAVIFSGIVSSEGVFDFESMTMATQVQMVSMIYILMVFIWIAGIPLALLASVTCGDFVSKEEQDGTLLLLASKPVRRHEIVLGKFLAFMINILVLESLVIILTPLMFYWMLPIDPFVLDTMAGLTPSLIGYALFVSLTFGALAAALSCISRSRFKTIISLVGVTVAVFFGFMVFRGWMVAADVYEPWGTWMDVNYHLGNSYMLFLDSTGYRMTPPLQAVLGGFTGVYDATDPGKLYDRDLMAMHTTLEPKEYATPQASLAWWLGLSLALLALGVLRFQKREIE
jgi:ABC-2 type transport system permease protein